MARGVNQVGACPPPNRGGADRPSRPPERLWREGVGPDPGGARPEEVVEPGLDLRDAPGQEGQPSPAPHLLQKCPLQGADAPAPALDLDRQKVAGDQLAEDVGAAGEGVAHEAALDLAGGVGGGDGVGADVEAMRPGDAVIPGQIDQDRALDIVLPGFQGGEWVGFHG